MSYLCSMLGSKFLRTLQTRRRFASRDRAWDKSARKQEFEAEMSSEPRALSQQEAELLKYILTNGSSQAQSFLPQLEGIRATRGCSCGCPSIKLHVAPNCCLGHANEHLLCDLVGQTAAGEAVGLLLFHSEGRLREFEVYILDEPKGTSNEFGLPLLESLAS